MSLRQKWRRRCRFSTMAGLAMLLALVSNSAAQDIPDPISDFTATPDEMTLFLAAAVNGVETQQIVQTRATKTGALFVARDDLIKLRIAIPSTGPKEVALASIQGLMAKYDEDRQRLELIADPEILLPQIVNALRQEEGLTLQGGTGFVLNYSLNATTPFVSDVSKLRLNGASAYLDSRFYSPYGMLETTMGLRSYSDALTNPSSVMRYDTSYSFSNADTRVTYVVGDLITGGLAWTRSYRAGGLQVRRDFSLQPDLITRPLLSTSGTAAVPSTIDVLLGGVKTFSTDVNSGPFTINNIPVITNVSGAKIVLRDATGQQTEIALPFFVGANLLAKDLLDYSLEIGAPRENYGLESFGYSRLPIATGSLRYGLTDRLTLEGHFETQAGLVNAGGGIATTLFDMAQVTLAASASRFHQAQGAQVYGALTTKYNSLNMEIASSMTLGTYRDLSYTTGLYSLSATNFALNSAYLEPPRWTHRLSLNAPLGNSDARVNFNLFGSRRGTGETRIISSGVTHTVRAYNASISAFAYADLGTQKSKGIFINLSVPLGKNILSNVSTLYDETRKIRPYASIAKLDDGSIGSLSYMGSAAYDANTRSGRAVTQYRSSAGLIRGEVRASSTGGSANASFAGALVVTDNTFHLTNQINDSFAIVQVGRPDVAILLDNRPAGITGRDGTALIPGLRSNQTNKMSIDISSLPLDFRVTELDRLVKPARKNGVQVAFQASAAASALVTLIAKNGEFVATGSTVRMNGNETEFIVGFDGEVWIEGDFLDENELVVTGADFSCKAQFAYAPQATDIFTRIDKVACK